MLHTETGCDRRSKEPVFSYADFTHSTVDYRSENTWTSGIFNVSSSKQFFEFVGQWNETSKRLIKSSGLPTTHNTVSSYVE